MWYPIEVYCTAWLNHGSEYCIAKKQCTGSMMEPYALWCCIPLFCTVPVWQNKLLQINIMVDEYIMCFHYLNIHYSSLLSQFSYREALRLCISLQHSHTVVVGVHSFKSTHFNWCHSVFLSWLTKSENVLGSNIIRMESFPWMEWLYLPHVNVFNADPATGFESSANLVYGIHY